MEFIVKEFSKSMIMSAIIEVRLSRCDYRGAIIEVRLSRCDYRGAIIVSNKAQRVDCIK